MDENVTVLPKKKSKVKYRYKQVIKKYRNNGFNCDHNTNLETFRYLLRIAEIIDRVKNDSYEMETMARNVLNEIKGNEVFYSKISSTSKLLEQLLPFTSNNDFTLFIKPIVDNLRPIFTNRVVSHLLEVIIAELSKRCAQSHSNSNEFSCVYFDTLKKITGFALNNVESFISNPNSNHVIRTVFNVMADAIAKKGNYDSPDINISAEFELAFEKFALRIVNIPYFNNMCNKTLSSGLLQTLLGSAKENESICKTIIEKIVACYKNEPPDLKDGKNEPLLRLLEAAMEVASEKLIRKIYKIFIRHDLRELSISRTANFAVQKLIRNCRTKEQFEIVFDELVKVGEDIFKARNTGVLYELAQGCVKHRSKQGEYVKMMLQVLKCQRTLNEDSDILPLMACMITSDVYDPEKSSVNLHGTLIIQAMLHFGKPIKMINSLLNMDQKHLLDLICDSRGCHIVDALMQSATVGEKSRERLFKTLKGCYVELVTSKHGSRALDALWSGITVKNKILLMEELMCHESEIMSNQFGRLFAFKNHLGYFRRNKEEWTARQKTMDNTKRCFSDIIPHKKPKLEV